MSWKTVGQGEALSCSRELGQAGAGVKQSFARCLVSVRLAKTQAQRNEAVRHMLASLSEWVPRFVENRLRYLGRGLVGLSSDIGEDAVQHVAIRIVQGRVTDLALTDDDLAKAWSKRVVLNYLRDEARSSRRRVSLVPARAVDSFAQDGALALKHDLQRFLDAVRAEVVRGCARNAVARATLFDEFVASFYESAPDDAGNGATASKRRRRGRLLASRAWASLCEADPAFGELEPIAQAFGLGAVPEATGVVGKRGATEKLSQVSAITALRR